MRILILNWYDLMNPAAGGAERYLHEIFGRLAANGHQVVLFCRRFEGSKQEEDIGGIHVIRVPASLRALTFGAMVMITRAWRYYQAHRDDYDLVVDCVNKAPFFTPLYVDKPRLALQHHFNGMTLFDELPKILAHMAAIVERRYFRPYAHDPFVVVSQSTQMECARYGISPAHCRIIFNGSTPAVVRHIPKAQVPTIVYVGRLKKYKGVELLLRAMAQVLSLHPQARMLIVGDGPERLVLKRLATKLRLGSSVRFEGQVSEQRRQELLESAWINAISSKKEGWGLSVVEAGVFGIPTVASKVLGLSESVVDGETGYLVEYGDIEGMAQAISKLLSNPAQRFEMGERARVFAKGFTWEESAAHMEDILRQVAGLSVPRREAADRSLAGTARS